MKYDPIWQAFRETGDPVYYLLYKSAAENTKEHTKDKKTLGPVPQVQD